MAYQELIVSQIDDKSITPTSLGFYLEHIFLPIAEEPGGVVIYSVDERTEKPFTKYKVSESFSNVFSGFTESVSGGAGRVGLIELTIKAVGSKILPTPESMLFPIANLSGPIRQSINPSFSNGTLSGTYQRLVCLDASGQASKEYYTELSQDSLVSLANKDAVGLKRLAKLFTLWRGYDNKFTPQEILFPVELIQMPIDSRNQYVTPAEPAGVTINVMERDKQNAMPYKITGGLSEGIELSDITTAISATPISSYYDVVNGNAPTFLG